MAERAKPKKKEAPPNPGKGSDQQQIFDTQIEKARADQTAEGTYIILPNISKGTACLHQGAINCDFRKLSDKSDSIAQHTVLISLNYWITVM